VVGDGADLDGDVGEHVLDVEHERAAAELRHPPAGEAERQRRRHGHDAVDAATAQAGGAGESAEGGEGCGAAGDGALVGRERMDAGDRAPLGRLDPGQLPRPGRRDPVLDVPRQRGDDVQLVAAVDQLEDDAGDDLAGRCQIRREVGAEDGELHERARR
jgi:hypothetical protein